MHHRSSAKERSKKGKSRSASATFLCVLIVFISLISGLSFYSIIHGASSVSLADNAMNLGISNPPPAVIPVVAGPQVEASHQVAAPTTSIVLSNTPDSKTKHIDARYENNVNKVEKIENKVVKKKKRMQVAFAITITRDGKFQDGAAVMAYSIDKAFRDDDMDISMIAFVHPNVTTSRAFLERVGYR